MEINYYIFYIFLMECDVKNVEFFILDFDKELIIC